MNNTVNLLPGPAYERYIDKTVVKCKKLKIVYTIRMCVI